MAFATGKPHHAALKNRPRNFEAVMAGLMLPVLDADLADPELARIETRVKREAKRRAEHVWHVAFLRCWAAKLDHDAEDYRRIIADPILGEGAPYDASRLVALRAAWVDAIDAAMRIPAPHVRALRWKQDHARIPRKWTQKARAEAPNPVWAALIADDVARLGKEA